jgi:hypothetical protein
MDFLHSGVLLPIWIIGSGFAIGVTLLMSNAATAVRRRPEPRASEQPPGAILR